MKMSCNGCRVLRKGCSDRCTIRPCLEWIKSPESQANATVFLAKFYGRAGLVNLINNGPDHLRPAIFRSLLYEACGRIVNPIYGSVGLLWSGSWHLCQAAVEAVLSGAPVAQIPSETAAATPVPPLRGYFDIRHVGKDQHDAPAAAVSAELHKASRTARTRFKRPCGGYAAAKLNPAAAAAANEMEEFWKASESSENESMFSAETAEASHVSQAERPGAQAAEESDVALDLTLGIEPSFPPPEAAAAALPEPQQGMRLWSGLGVGLLLPK